LNLNFKKNIDHKLAYSCAKKEKVKYQDQLSEPNKIDTQLNIEVGKNMLYLFNGFHNLPHGDAKFKDLKEAKKVLQNAGVTIQEIKKKDHFCFKYDEVKVFYQGEKNFRDFYLHFN